MLDEMRKDSREQILEGTFKYLVKFGLENIRIRHLCQHIGFVQGSVYYWFKNKEELVCESTTYGLKKTCDDIFDYLSNSMYDIDVFFDNCLENLNKSKDELRFIYQMAASPAYGKMMHDSSVRFVDMYDKYADILAKSTGADVEQIKPIVYIFAATVIDYAIWQCEDEVRIQLDYIRKKIKEVINKQ